jgi:putative transcriptional regulator
VALLFSLPLPDAAAPPGQPPLAAGVLLVAHPRLPDPNFARTVVLVLQHERSGSTGLVLNRPTSVEPRSVLPELAPLEGRATVHLGGPVMPSRIQLLVGSGPAEARVVDGVYLVRSLQELERTLADPAHPFLRAYAGYAGWAPGQLEAELARGDWFLLPARAADVFASDREAAELWRRLLDRATLPWV